MGIPKDRSRLVFMQHGPFERAFPTLDDAVAEYVEWDYAIKKREGTWRVKEYGGLMACANERCRRGGYEIDREIHQMIREKLTEKKVRMLCRGDEGSPKGRRRGRSCTCALDAILRVTYKSPSPITPQ